MLTLITQGSDPHRYPAKTAKPKTGRSKNELIRHREVVNEQYVRSQEIPNEELAVTSIFFPQMLTHDPWDYIDTTTHLPIF